MKSLTIALTALALTATSATAEMSLSFKNWGGIPLCTSGNPNKVGNPAFVLKGVPAGTNKLVFKLTDLDVRSYNHGGGTVKIKQGGNMKIPAGVFKYKSPCPPSGKHTYEWSVTAKQGGKTLAKAKAAKKYP
ncbi:YbhB/YbcL family Raf kinase inhibitor-like protein [Alisedimentitalea sp. MJ-SS2]|uniref:YbhB/YbcL family Raf kinase inhibitor-like protein n=1 Tax=Aliisedimentitalea sp. MJ-SS2 TaxID=3049795 RepID=UPI00290C56A6|nr:YbhB/YbcL family Raf kinase inhibitor-like protein [Alisedimentitalea sp. MJ-SS2]MDU8929272.1 YbhB/YbcL family Raf kinase inhibitor-like protein [Alisedimentitalea sp. MJ-SS2]